MGATVKASIISAAILLAGCTTHEERLAADAQYCASISQSEEIRAQCLIGLQNVRAQRSAQISSGMMAMSQAMIAQPPPRQMVNTTCNRFGNTVNCTSF